jgi:membrane-bound lytic murein transglycosylase D
MGLRVDKEIDERMNIVSSSRAAAQYLKKNNFYFNNWLYALQAYQMGAGGVMRSINDYQSGASHMEITSKTYWYVKKFLAHKVAFENALKGPAEVTVVPYENQKKTMLADIAKEVSVPAEKLEEFNKWIRKGTIPDDRKYTVVIPVHGDARQVFASVARTNSPSATGKESGNRKLNARPAVATSLDKKYIHGLPAIKPEPGESASSLAKRAGVSLSYFLSCNDLSISDPLYENQYYYLKKKKSKSTTDRHTVVRQDETLWSISQQYGIQLKRVRKVNPGLPSGNLKTGTIVMIPAGMNSGKPVAETKPPVEVVELETGEFFNWSIKPETTEVIASASPITEAKPAQESVRPASESTIPGPGQNPGPLPDKHVVAAGETLYSISKRYNVGVMDLVNWNQLSLQEGIKPGQILKIKGEEQGALTESQPVKAQDGSSGIIVYEVKASDTLYSVARQYGVTIKDLMDWNKKKDFNVSVGEKLVIQQK